MGWIFRHWVALLSAVPLALPVLRWFGWLISRGGDADFVISRSTDPGWVGTMINWIIDPPVWSYVPLIAAGLLLIYWDVRRNRNTSTVGQVSNPTDTARSGGPPPATSGATYTHMNGQVRHNIHKHGGAMIVGPKGKAFPLRFSVASRDRAHISKGSLKYLARIRGKAKGDRLIVEQYPDSPTFAVSAGERFLAINDAGYLIQGLIVTVKDDRYDEYDEIVFKYRITQSEQEITAI